MKLAPVPLFTIPVWNEDMPNFQVYQSKFIEEVKNCRAKDPEGVSRSNLYGWQSQPTIHSIESFNPLFDFILNRSRLAANSIGLDSNIGISAAWINVNDSSACINFQHIHAGVISGIFYLQVPEGSGQLNLINPGMNQLWEGLGIVKERNQFTNEALGIIPTEGTLIMWPGYVPHSVGSNLHNQSRISIAFNTTILESNGTT